MAITILDIAKSCLTAQPMTVAALRAALEDADQEAVVVIGYDDGACLEPLMPHHLKGDDHAIDGYRNEFSTADPPGLFLIDISQSSAPDEGDEDNPLDWPYGRKER